MSIYKLENKMAGTSLDWEKINTPIRTAVKIPTEKELYMKGLALQDKLDLPRGKKGRSYRQTGNIPKALQKQIDVHAQLIAGYIDTNYYTGKIDYVALRSLLLLIPVEEKREEILQKIFDRLTEKKPHGAKKRSAPVPVTDKQKIIARRLEDVRKEFKNFKPRLFRDALQVSLDIRALGPIEKLTGKMSADQHLRYLEASFAKGKPPENLSEQFDQIRIKISFIKSVVARIKLDKKAALLETDQEQKENFFHNALIETFNFQKEARDKYLLDLRETAVENGLDMFLEEEYFDGLPPLEETVEEEEIFALPVMMSPEEYIDEHFEPVLQLKKKKSREKHLSFMMDIAPKNKRLDVCKAFAQNATFPGLVKKTVSLIGGGPDNDRLLRVMIDEVTKHNHENGHNRRIYAEQRSLIVAAAASISVFKPEL
jgi:hypothetical protein